MPTIQPMTQELVYQTLYAALGLSDAILQIWITLTFAVIVSTYVAGDRFNRNVYRLISGLYSLASVVLFTRFLSATVQIFHYKEMLVTRGFEPWPVSSFVAITIGVGTSTLLVAGTAATLWFVRSVRRDIEEATR